MVTTDNLREKAGILQTFMENHRGTPNQSKKIRSKLKLLKQLQKYYFEDPKDQNLAVLPDP